MIHYTYNQEASVSYGCTTGLTDALAKSLTLPMYQSGTAILPSVFPTNIRSDVDTLSHSRKNTIGERKVFNLQLGVDLTPAVIDDSLYHSSFSYDDGMGAYLASRQASYPEGTFNAIGVCYYNANYDLAFAPIQDKFATHVHKLTNYSSYDLVYDRSQIYSWVPLGTCSALVVTRYTCNKMLRKYQASSSATCSVTVYWPKIVSGSVSIQTIYLGTVLSATGATPQFDAVMALALDCVPDPTSVALGRIQTLATITGLPAIAPYLRNVHYDPKATDEKYISLVMSRLSKIGLDVAQNSLQHCPNYDEWADLADTAIDNCKFVDINAYAFARDLRTVGSELKSLSQLAANPMNPKAWAGLYLNLRYGTRLTVSDTRELMEGLKRSSKNMTSTWPKGFDVVRSQKVTAPHHFALALAETRTMHYKVCYKPDRSPLKVMLKRLWDWDMYPSLQNLWDLVPYSFCVDWGGDIEKVLEQLDREQYEELIKVLGCTYSFKDEYLIPVELVDLGFQDAVLAVTLYSRSTSSLHQSSLRLTAGHSSAINVVDGISLILQRMK